LAPTATGFTVTFSKPVVAADIFMYGGTTASPVQDVTLVGVKSGPINGSLVIDPSGTSATFKASSTFLQTFFGQSVLPDDTWTATLVSGMGTGSSAHGFFDVLGAALDSANVAGHAGYTTSFTSANVGKPILSIPDFARGLDDAGTIKVPNDSGKGIPVTLTNASAATDVVFSLTYNPTLFTPTGAGTGDSTGAGSNFVMGNVVKIDALHSMVKFTWHNATAQNRTVALGDILGVVPGSALNLYKSMELLDLSSITVNGAAFGGVAANGVHVNAYLGDVTGDGKITGLDVAAASSIAQGNPISPIGLSAYKLVDPAIVGDIAGDASIDATAVSDLAAFTTHLSVPQIPAPPTPVPTMVLLNPSAATGTSGTPLTLTVTVSSAVPGAGTPTGTVTFFDGAAALGMASLDASGQAALTVGLGTGNHSLTVLYDGDVNFQSGLSAPVTFLGT
jgi:hypothetical protein